MDADSRARDAFTGLARETQRVLDKRGAQEAGNIVLPYALPYS